MAVNELLSGLLAVSMNPGVPQDAVVIHAPAPADKGWIVYTLQNGDTLSELSSRYGVSQKLIIWSNGIKNAQLRAGDDIKIPLIKESTPDEVRLPPGFFVYTTQRGDTLKGISKKFSRSMLSLVSANPDIGTIGRVETGRVMYIPSKTKNGLLVEFGKKDNLLTIARRFGVSVGDLAKANKIQTVDALKNGDRVVIPDKQATTTFNTLLQQHQARIRAEKLAEIKDRRDAAAQKRRQYELYQRYAKYVQAQREAKTAAERRAAAAAAEAARQEAARQRQAAAAAAQPKPVVRSVNYAVAASGYRQPVSYVAITTYFGTRGYRQRFHAGVDFAAPYGTPIYAARSGTIQHASWSSNGYGLNVIINHGDAFTSLYGHMSRVIVGRGQWVERGQLIGYVGSTGMSTGPHLHFEIRRNGVARNPLRYL